MKTLAIVQARMGSTRLPGKVMCLLNGKPMIEILLDRLSSARQIDHIVVATSKNQNNVPLTKYLADIGYHSFVGSEDNVLERFASVATEHSPDIIVRVTGDCPLVDPGIVDRLVSEFKDGGVDYLSNTICPTFPDGLDVEVFSFEALMLASKRARNAFDQEHVTPYMKEGGEFLRRSIVNEKDFSALRWTVDDPVDLEVVNEIFEYFSPNINFSWSEVIDLYLKNPERFRANSNIQRDQGAFMGTGQKLWRRAKRVIPGGNMLLSKRPEMFLPELWPAYFSKSSGCKVWDLDGNQYIDMSIMGIGTNTLGYNHPEVDEAVIKAVRDGNMSTLNCPEEVELAEKLIDMHPWADMARFARSGGEANAIAIRIARAASGREVVAFCGYHGWHDWYLAANLDNDRGLDGHLLPGLQPKGVPRNLAGTSLPFEYNNYDQLLDLVNSNDVGVIKMEVARNIEADESFLSKVRNLADERNIVLIFDECTSGFRETFGGFHKKYSVEPDIAMFGKALGNGYAVTAVIGRREIMEVAQATFISSTFWTERIGSVAALKTLEVMERDKSWLKITEKGRTIQNGWQELANKFDIKIAHWGLPALAGFTVKSANALAYKTLVTQEMLKNGFLASNSVYASTAHDSEAIDQYFSALNPIFSLINDCENGRDVNELLDGPACHSGFKRLN